jgi:RNA polymerase sigma factor (TIGR02999 family)
VIGKNESRWSERDNQLAEVARAMTTVGAQEVSQLLAAWSEGNQQALQDLVPLVYPQLRRIARQHLRSQAADHTLESTALVHELYLKLFRAPTVRCDHRTHFYAMCAQIIRRILVDHARARSYAKRGGNATQVSLNEALLGSLGRSVEVVALDDALLELARIDPRKSKVVELRFFGGLTIDETADVLCVSADTVLRDWKLAKVWLFRALQRR